MATNEELSEILKKNAQSLLDEIKFAEEGIRLSQQRVRESREELAPLMKLLLHLDPDSPLKNDETYMATLRLPDIKWLQGMEMIPKTKHHDFEVQLVELFSDNPIRTKDIMEQLRSRDIEIPNRQSTVNLTVILDRSPFFTRMGRGVWGLTYIGYKVKEENDGEH